MFIYVYVSSYVNMNITMYVYFFFLRAISIAPLQVNYYNSTDTLLKFHAEAPQATASEGLAQGPYVAARAGFV